MRKLSLIIPCYNEERFIDQVIDKVEAVTLPPGWQKEIIIVDDCSTDGTRERLSKYQDKYLVVLRDKNGGKGSAVKTGLLKVSGDFVLIQDADLEYDPNDYRTLISALNEKRTTVFGSRLLKQNKCFNFIYLYGNRTMAMIFNILFGSHFTDITTCYKLFPRGAIPQLLNWKEDSFVYDAIYLTYELHKFSQNIAEVPISYSPRSRSEGKKVNWRNGAKALIAMIKIKLGKDLAHDIAVAQSSRI